MVAIQENLLTLYFFDHKRARVTLPVRTLQLTTHFHPGRELAPGNGLHKIFVALAERILRLQIKRDLVASGLPFQRFFDFGRDIAITAVQIGCRLFAVVKQLAGQFRNFEAYRDRGVLFDFHVLTKISVKPSL